MWGDMQRDDTTRGATLVHLRGAGGAAPEPSEELLGGMRRVIAFDAPDAADPAEAVLAAVAGLGIETFDVLGTSGGAATALRVAIRAPERVSALVLESPVVARDAELEEALRGLAVPVLVLVGTRDEVVPPETGRVYRELLPNCQLLYVYDAGHAIAADRPEAFTEAVADFLERREQYVVSRASSVLFP